MYINLYCSFSFFTNLQMIIPFLTKEELFNKISQEAIFQRYLHINPTLNEKFINTLREDNTPDCSFYFAKSSGELRFKDFAYGYNWSCIDVVMIKYNLNFREAINKIIIDFRIFDFNNSSNNQDNYEIEKIKKLIPIEKLETLIEIKKRRFEQIDIDYWQQFHLEPKDLIYVYPTQNIWVNKQRFYNHNNLDIAYSYGLGNGKYKCYFPFRSKKKRGFKFIQSGGYVQGLRLLPKTNEDLLIITKSYKDLLVLRKLGYYAIAPASENSLMDINLITYLKKQFKEIIIFFDNDSAGMFNSNIQLEKYNLDKQIFIPPNYPKDISDFIKEEGIDAGFELMEYLITN